MYPYTKDEWKLFETMYDELGTFAFAYVVEATGNPRGYAITNVFIHEGKIEIEYDDSCFGNNSCDYESCPVHYLWTEDWRAEFAAVREEQARLAEEKAVRKRLVEMEEIEREQRALYEELEQKFGKK